VGRGDAGRLGVLWWQIFDAFVETVANLSRSQLGAATLVADDDGAGGSNTSNTSQP